MKEYIVSMPAVGQVVRELIRCKDCKYWNADDHDCNIKVGHFTAPPDWFCADGERK